MLQSERSLDNLSRLSNARSGVDIALVQSGVLESGDAVDLVSLGSMFYEPLTIFYRSPKALQQSAGQFPNPMTHTFPISVEAARYHKSGSRSFLYRYLPFWLASLANRGLVVLLPIIVVVIPGLRFLPQMYRWRIDNRVHRRYGELMALERETLGEPDRATASSPS